MNKNGTSQTQSQKRRIRQKVVAGKLKRQAAKERTKVAKEIHKLQQLGEGDLNPHIQQLRKENEATREGLNRLIQAYNSNAKTYNAAFQQLDAQIGAAKLVINDLVACLLAAGQPLPELTTVEKDEKSVVFWVAYIKHYVENVRKELLRMSTKAQDAPKEDPLLTPEVVDTPDTSDVVFGGDHV